uniref:Uncharacterized protein n=1 Tax=Peronospora matthiolae TaxID=2874970 RepID=A0AAV1T624_9STRA
MPDNVSTGLAKGTVACPTAPVGGCAPSFSSRLGGAGSASPTSASAKLSRSGPLPPMGYASLLQNGAGHMKKGKPTSPVSFDIAKPSDSDLVAMIQLYDDGADRDVILRNTCPEPGRSRSLSVLGGLEGGALFRRWSPPSILTPF